ncbi:unnamed protein product [Rotaria magnacalcarata]|uniref:RWD domain-containing protein 3 n=1 Tax=Rotaria magnacalcarata TaxID=392030 RepID=A0A816S6D8_9BILA|nr:unnamed protein product [Rotaria magnacalcarata]
MQEQIEVLKAIYSRRNEIVYDDVSQIITYNAFDDNLQCIGFSTRVYMNNAIIVESNILTNDELKQLRENACLKTTLYDLFTVLKSLYDELMMKRTKETVPLKESSSSILMKIDHMRSPNIYMKHLRQWTNELNITGGVLVIPHTIFILVEGNNDNLKKFIIKLKTETVDIDSRGRPCKERLLTQIVAINTHSSKFSNFEKIEFNNRNELESYLTKSDYAELLNYIKN